MAVATRSAGAAETALKDYLSRALAETDAAASGADGSDLGVAAGPAATQRAERYLDTVLRQPAPAPLPAEVSAYVREALAASTRRKYQQDLKRFLGWGGRIPASEVDIARYLAAFGHSHAPATLQRWLVSIGKAHTARQLPNPCKSELVHLTLRGIRRARTDASRPGLQHRDLGLQRGYQRRRGPTGALRGQVAALELKDLKRIIDALGDAPKDARDRALLLTGFMGARRRSELAAMTLGDLSFVDEGVIIRIPYSKTDQEGRGEEIDIGYADDDAYCPVGALRDWLETYLLPRYPDEELTTALPVFRPVNRYGSIGARALTDRSIARIVKAHCQAVGLNVDDFSGHSLRAGFATAAARLGRPGWEIRKQTLHRSETMLNRYIRDGQRFKRNPGKGML